MSNIKLGSQVKFVSDDTRKGAVVSLNGDTATVRLKGSKEEVSAPTSELKTVRGRPLTIKA